MFKKEGSEICAIMPYEISDLKGNMTSYAHVGQYSACCIEYVTKLHNATPEEYADLQKELEDDGYTFKLSKRISFRRWAEAYRVMLQENALNAE